jgi:predicted acyl esterase
MRVERDVYIRMRDGVRLAADLYLPGEEGRFPALLSLCPYSKDTQGLPLRPVSEEEGIDPFWTGLEAGISEYFVSRGYAHVVVDIRGTGKSEGEFSPFSREQVEDGYELVEWVARQPWCDGNVGMVGISYFAVIQYLVAALQPPHLKAIFPLDGFTDLYRDCAYHGGILSNFANVWYHLMVGAAEALLGPEGSQNLSFRVVSTAPRLLPPEVLEGLVNSLKEDPSLKNRSDLLEILEHPELNPVMYDLLLAYFEDSEVFPPELVSQMYKERSPYTKLERIRVPAYVGSGWHAVGLHLRGAFTAWEGLRTPKKLLLGPPKFMDRPFCQYHGEIVRWYDYWLKGVDTGIMKEPPVKLFVMGINRWRYEEEWPLARTRWTRYYLHHGGLLSPFPPGEEKPETYRYRPGEGSGALVWSTPSMEEETEVTGPLALYLYASSTATDTDWFVKLLDVDPEGKRRFLTRGWLRASHREVDRGRSRPWRPFHPHRLEGLSPLEPGKIYEFAIEILPTSNVFLKGHRLQLEVRSDDGPPEIYLDHAILPHLVRGEEALNTVYHSPSFPSHLLLPLVPPGGREAPPPA